MNLKNFPNINNLYHENKIFVAGHNGLIGSAVVNKFKSSGFKNILTVPRSKLDLTNASNTYNFLKTEKPDYVVLAAGYTGGILENKINSHELLNLNLKIQLNIISTAFEIGVKKLIFFGSSCMYPKEVLQPMVETNLLKGKPDENSLSYALAKLIGLEMCRNYNRIMNSNNFISLIPNTVYGPKDNFDPNTGHVISSLISRFLKAKTLKQDTISLWGTGNVKREFLFSEDLAEICLLILENDNFDIDPIINVGSGEEISIKKLSKEIAKLTKYDGKIIWDKTKPNVDSRKL